MKSVSVEAKTPYVGRRTSTLLAELGDACQQVLKLLAKLEMTGLSERQVDDLLGDLSAQILHIHEHTRDLDKTVIRGGR